MGYGRDRRDRDARGSDLEDQLPWPGKGSRPASVRRGPVDVGKGIAWPARQDDPGATFDHLVDEANAAIEKLREAIRKRSFDDAVGATSAVERALRFLHETLHAPNVGAERRAQ